MRYPNWIIYAIDTYDFSSCSEVTSDRLQIFQDICSCRYRNEHSSGRGFSMIIVLIHSNNLNDIGNLDIAVDIVQKRIDLYLHLPDYYLMSGEIFKYGLHYFVLYDTESDQKTDILYRRDFANYAL